MRNNLFLGAAIAALVIPAAASAQETTASIRGNVTAAGAAVAGANVIVTHVPSGTRSTATTGADGSFNLTGLRTGGPFTVEVSSPQGSTQVTDVFTVLGQTYDLPIELADGSTGGDIVVTAASIIGAGTTSDGPQTVLTREDIAKVASVNRDIRDLERRDPFATLDLANSRAVSFAGVNPRFNRFSVNGVSVSDNFGLNPDASPTGRGPVPLDAIGQFTVSTAPYDVRQGNFQGGAIDLVLLSGTNSFHGTGFYSQFTDGLYGEKIGSFTRPVTSFKSETYGATLSGPIIKDKLFFMVSGERNTEPRPLAIASIGQIPNLAQSVADGISAIAQSKYGYTTGGIIDVANQKDEKIVGKIDWNITDGQKLALTYINAYDEFEFNQNTSNSATSPSLGLRSNGYRLTELLRSGIVQLNSDWSDSFSTEIRGQYKSYTRGQNPLLGRGFAQFAVCLDPTSTTTPSGAANTSNLTACSNGTPRVFFGPDISRQANEFNTDTWGGSFLGRLTSGNHDIKVFAEANKTKIYNLFLQNAAGSYYFDSIADFQAGNANTLTYQNATSLNLNDAASRFGYWQFTFGAQDDWKIFDNLTLSAGARYDLYGMRSTVPYNPNFQSRLGYANTKTFKGLGLFSPRVSLDWKPPVKNLNIRGGVGIFGGGSPDVYLSNSYSNTGIVTNQININRATGGTFTGGASTAVGQAALNGVTGTSFSPLVTNFLSTNTASLTTAPTNALDQSFNLPSILKATASADYTIFGFDVGADYYYSNTIDAVTFSDGRLVANGLLTPDGRIRYSSRTTAGDANYDIILGNTSQGRSHIGVFRVNKTFDFGLSGGISYTIQDVKDASAATSSTATSNYGQAAFIDGNQVAYGTGNDETKWAFKYNVGFDHAFFGDYKTIIQLFGETRAGRPYSFTMQDATAGTSNTIRSPIFGSVRQQNRYLMYVPTSTTDPLVSYDSAATQQAVETLIGNTKLKDYRGKIAGRNIARSRAFTRLDIHLEQQIPTFVGKSRLSVFADIENLPNLLNSKWGGLRQFGFPYISDVVRVTCLQTPVATGTAATAAQTTTASTQPCAQYRYSAYTETNESTPSISNSLYSIRIGARFTF